MRCIKLLQQPNLSQIGLNRSPAVHVVEIVLAKDRGVNVLTSTAHQDFRHGLGQET